jgi:predicted lipoprotein with Yx(FWY)xxD motif
MPRATRPTLISLAAVVALVVAGCGSSSSSSNTSAASSSGPEVIAKSTSLGKVLTDGSGRTLYLFEKDSGPKSQCSGACATNWPPFTSATKPGVSGGATGSDVTLINRSGGAMQVTYNGHPLYYYVGDKSAGDLNGQGINAFGASWFVLSPGGSKVSGKPSSPGGSSSSGGKGSYGGY